ncbi:hypothetical protein FRB94_009611 [Tulasnella sp. JGI-2019a]|nr:hypothetical protein FRB94_009611 [Tulasnella sp. JGI-2019a]KAG9034999.1 hypothetical protein FRB95_012289 [Tulasnella sp. JGI-2019a]
MFDNTPPSDQTTPTAVVTYKDALVKWKPGGGFCVAHSHGIARYALLNEETDSIGEEEDEAMHKMSVVSKHSDGIIRQLTGKGRVILSVYVSEDTCTMYLSYKSSVVGEKYDMRQVLWLRDIFSHPTHVVGFLRRLHNFATSVEPLDEILTPIQKRKQEVIEILGKNLLTAQFTATRPKKQKTGSSNKRGETPPTWCQQEPRSQV